MFANDTGLIVVISGPSGGGKSTIVRSVLDSDPDAFFYSVSDTTRTIRTGEEEGRDYHFISREEFTARHGRGYYLEHNRYTGSSAYYGTPKAPVEKALADNRIAILEIDVNGGRQVKAVYPAQTLLLFLMPPTLSELEERLRGRQDSTMTEERIRSRLSAARREVESLAEYDAIVYNLNNRQDRAVNDVRGAIDAFIARRRFLLDSGRCFLGE